MSNSIGGDDGALASERGERHTIEAFTRALGRSLPDEIHEVVQSQLGRVLVASAALRREIANLEELEETFES